MILAADVLEHVRSPGAILEQVAPLLAPGGSLIASVPNFGHWYPRPAGGVGRFDYDRRGILDQRPRPLLHQAQLRATGGEAAATGRCVGSGTGLPLEVVERGGNGQEAGSGMAARGLSRLDQAAVAMRPQLFAYQLVYELVRKESD